MSRFLPFMAGLFNTTGVAANSIVRTLFDDYALFVFIPAILIFGIGVVLYKRQRKP